MNAEISILVQNTKSFENLEEKNEFIQASKSEWIGFIDGGVTGEEEVRQILEENPFLLDYDVILFGNDVPEGECGLLELLEHPQSIIYALFFRKSLLAYTGSYNRFLHGNNHYEFLLRLAKRGNIYSIPSSADKSTEFAPQTMAYIVRYYMETLKTHGRLDESFLRIVQLAERNGKTAEFNKEMNEFLSDTKKYEKLASDTAPCLIMVSNDVEWYGVVEGFANSMADELVGLGQAVITTNGRYGDYYNLPKELLLNQVYKAIVGFQSPALQSETFQNMKGKRYQIWLDDPVFFIDFLRKTPRQIYFLCQDANYAKFLRDHFNIERAEQFPPAGMVGEEIHQERIYDLVFIGSYIPCIQVNYEDAFLQEFVQYMQNHLSSTVEQGVCAVWKKLEISYDEERFMQTVEELGDVCHNLLQMYRHRVVEAILNAGIQLHVFGDSWRNYQGSGQENLIIHPKVMAEESLQIWVQAKIGLNIMNGHKAGMTERIANIMLSGACCLSDETSYLKEHFADDKDIALFRVDNLDGLVDKIQYLLQNDEERERIASNGKKKALREHTWRKRTEELLELVHKENEANNE